MQRIRLGSTNIEVTPVGLGVLTIGNTQLNQPLQEGAALVRYAYDQGIRLFDTAQYYETYPYIREAFRDIDCCRENPDRPIIASKSLDRSYEEMEAAIEEALRELNLDYIDIFKLHEVRQDPDWDSRAGAWQCLRDYKARGVIGAIGVSTHHIDVVQRMVHVPECDIVFPLINYAGLGIRKGAQPGSPEEMSEAIRACIAAGKGVFAMKAFGGGNLSGQYRQALDFVQRLGVHSIMVGMGKTEEVDRLISWAEGTLPEDYVPDISFKRIHVDQGDCEGCGRCIDRCPNKAIFRNASGLAEVNYDICLTCGYCAPVCPVRAIIMW
ncbi:MAG: aldo/keto reductase [Firmicutes bacterium]|nr:aldo/keto reductase [Bacillota bacterium]